MSKTMKRTFSFGQLEDLIQDALVMIQEDELTTLDALAKVIKGNEVTWFADVAYIRKGVEGRIRSKKRYQPEPLTGRIR